MCMALRPTDSCDPHALQVQDMVAEVAILMSPGPKRSDATAGDEVAI